MRVLLHACCGPCSIYPIQSLRDEGYKPHGFFFNPNIHPFKEFERRRDTLREYAAAIELPLIVDDRYLLEGFLRQALALEKQRCVGCYEMRLRETARYARENDYEAFTTTLLVSPYQKHDMIHDIACRIAIDETIPFLYRDFRPGWSEGTRISRERNMYRQPYCGCIFSEKERYCKTSTGGD